MKYSYVLALGALLAVTADTQSAIDYETLFRQIGEFQGTIKTNFLNQKSLDFRHCDWNFDAPLALLDLLMLEDMPDQLRQQRSVLEKAYFKGFQQAFSPKNSTGNDSTVREWLINMVMTILSCSQTEESYTQAMKKLIPEFGEIFSTLNEKDKEKVSIFIRGNNSLLFDLCSLCSTSTYYIEGRNLGRRLYNNLLKELQGETLPKGEKQAIIQELFEVVTTLFSSSIPESPKDSPVAHYLAGIYLSRYEIDIPSSCMFEEEDSYKRLMAEGRYTRLMDAFNETRWVIGQLLEKFVGLFHFSYNGCYRRVEIVENTHTQLTIRIIEGSFY